MNDTDCIAEFRFVTNSSFKKSRVITVPSRFKDALKGYELAQAAAALVTFRDDPQITGSIREGWRAGGRYFQIRLSGFDADSEISRTKLGVCLTVRVIKSAEGWNVDIK